MASIGNCWLVSTMKALARSEKGLKTLNKSLKLNDDGSVTVHLQGVNKEYTISAQELNDGNIYSLGDLDARAIIIAANKYMLEYHMDDVDDNTMETAIRILVGNNPVTKVETLPKNYDKLTNCPDCINQAAIYKFDNKDLPKVKYKKSQKERPLVNHHAYNVVKVTDKEVVLDDPRFFDGEFTMSREEFEKYFHIWEHTNI